MLSAPIPATAHALRRAGMRIGDLDAVEVNEAFAPVVPAWLKETGADPARVTPNGGAPAPALGRPPGAIGARLTTSLLHELERTGGRYGLQTMGQANVTIIERLQDPRRGGSRSRRPEEPRVKDAPAGTVERSADPAGPIARKRVPGAPGQSFANGFQVLRSRMRP